MAYLALGFSHGDEFITSPRTFLATASSGVAERTQAPIQSDTPRVEPEQVENEQQIFQTYVPLHVHTDFSFLDGASQIPRLVKKAKSLGVPALAITDHGAMHGAIELIKECNKHGIKPIVGNEMYLVNGNLDDRNPKERRFHVVVLAKNTTGYRNLVKLTTISHLDGFYYKPRINKQKLLEHKEGLIVASACLGSEISQTLLKAHEDPSMYEVAKQIALWYKDNFGDDFYLEIQDHGYSEDRIVNPQILKLARELGIKVIATNDSHFTEEEESQAHDALLCVQTGKQGEPAWHRCFQR